MTLEEFKKMVSEGTESLDLAKPLQALLVDARGDWDRAHKIAQSISSWEGAWIHAYLHRKEGDHGNAAYWYSHAGKPRSELSLEEEWEEICRDLLES
jgi:hypothetical protein